MDSSAPKGHLRLTDDDPWAGFSRWLADGRVDAAAATRARQHWLERQGAEEATLSGVLLDLAENSHPVAVLSRGGRTARGPVVAVGADFVAVREDHLGDILIPQHSIATVRATPGGPPVVGDRPLALEIVLAEALLELGAARPIVLVAAAGSELRGELRRGGRDVVAVTLDSETRDTIHVAIESIDHLVILTR